jgi:aldose 1-epimerase
MAAVLLKAGQYEATFRPDIAMLCTSLRYRGEEYVAWPRPISQFRAGNATAIPPLHPWSNRLGRWSYTAGGRRVNLRGLRLPTDTNGLPIHGNLFGAPFDVVRADDTRLVARLDYGAHPEKLRAFPFPHVLTIDARLDEKRGLTIATEVRPTGGRAVPVSFGWHPYVKLPGGRRAEWELRWPACEHVEVDRNIIPTGARTPQPAERAPIASRTFDDHYALGRDRRFSIATNRHSLTFRFDAKYPFAQLFVPPRKQLVAIEPMTATIDALGSGTAPLVDPGDRFRAAFSLQADAHVS